MNQVCVYFGSVEINGCRGESFAGKNGQYWFRTSDLFGVNEALYH